MRSCPDRRKIYLQEPPPLVDREAPPEVAGIFYGDFSVLPADPTFDDFWVLHSALNGGEVATDFGFNGLEDAATDRFRRTGRWEGELLELWLALYSTCRSTHHMGWEPPEEEWRSLYQAMRQRLLHPVPGDPCLVGYRPDRPHERGTDLSERFRGAMLGLAVGDAVGTTLEFQSPGRFEPIDDMIGGGPFGLAAGQWTDDTSMALCLAHSLIEVGFQPLDQMQRYLRWYRSGYMSSTGQCFDIGNTIRAALEEFEQSAEPFSGSRDPRSAGNGSLMRLAPVPLFSYQAPAAAIRLAGESSRTTHGSPAAMDACRYFSGLMVGSLKGYDKAALLSSCFSPVARYYQAHPLCAEIAAVANGSFKRKQPPEIRGTGYVVESLKAALWAFDRGETFEETVLLAVNLGHDADTTGAIAGQLAGAYYGVEGIPAHWRSRLAQNDLIDKCAWGLYERGRQDPGPGPY